MKRSDLETKIIYYMADYTGLELPDSFAKGILDLVLEEGMLPPNKDINKAYMLPIQFGRTWVREFINNHSWEPEEVGGELRQKRQASNDEDTES